VRKISFGEGVERTFALYSPNLDTIKVIRSGKVRRAKLYYLRDRKGKSARIAERLRKKIGIDVSTEKVETKTASPESQNQNLSSKPDEKKDSKSTIKEKK